MRAQRLPFRDPQGQGLACEGLDLRGPCGRGNVEPAGLLGRVDPLQTARTAPGRSGLLPCGEHAGLVRVEVVADQGDVLRLGTVHVYGVLQDLGASQFCAPRGHLHLPPARHGRRDHEEMGRAGAPGRILLAGGLSGPDGQRGALPDARPGRPRPRTPPGGLHKDIFWAGIGGCVRIGGPAPCVAGPGAARATVSGVVRAERRRVGGRAGVAGRLRAALALWVEGTRLGLNGCQDTVTLALAQGLRGPRNPHTLRRRQRVRRGWVPTGGRELAQEPRVLAVDPRPEQLCWMSSLQREQMVFDPGFLGLDHGIENGEQFAHGRDEGDFFGFADCAQVPVQLADHRVVPGGGQSGHVQGRAHLCTASPHSALASELATVAVERGHAHEGGDLAAVQLAQLGQFGQEHAGQDRTDTGHALQQGILLLPGGMSLALDLQLPVHLCQFGLQPREVALGQFLALGARSVPPCALLGDGGHEVAAGGHQIA